MRNRMAKTNDDASKMSPLTAPKQASYDGDVVTDLKSDDVLLGRGIGPNEHQGNVRFREIVCSLRSEYLATSKRKAKDKIAHKAMQIIKARQGRFLRKMNEPAAKPVGAKDVYVIADEKTAVEKTKQALRFVGRKRHSDSNEDQEQEDQALAASPSAPASVGAHQARSGLPKHIGGTALLDQMGRTFPNQGGGDLSLNCSREGYPQTLLLANELNWDSAIRSRRPSLLLDSTLRYLSEQHEAPSNQHARLFSDFSQQALGRLQQIQAMLPPPIIGAPHLMDSMSYNHLPLLQQHNQSFVSSFLNSARQNSNQFESLQSGILPSTPFNRLTLEDSLIAAALRRPPSYLRESQQPLDTRNIMPIN